jgi:hypothetical protein
VRLSSERVRDCFHSFFFPFQFVVRKFLTVGGVVRFLRGIAYLFTKLSRAERKCKITDVGLEDATLPEKRKYLDQQLKEQQILDRKNHESSMRLGSLQIDGKEDTADELEEEDTDSNTDSDSETEQLILEIRRSDKAPVARETFMKDLLIKAMPVREADKIIFVCDICQKK